MTATARAWLEALGATGRPDELETKQLLAAHGLRVPQALRVRLDRGPVTADDPGIGFEPPYVVKVCSAEILHKTDQGGVRLGVDRRSLPSVVSELQARFPGSDLLVEEQVRFAGTEFIIGAFRDPSFGPALMVGAGGILTELYQDVAFRLVPCSTAEAMRMLRELKVFPVLEGFRGRSMDARALAEAVGRVGEIVEALGDRFEQLDVNPIVNGPSGWTALDAKLILRS
ncbi:MAG TPA: acetate--CoA ligase family protein [Spirochaetia bacterium]|nr:acetate--CoA ligase family protein [Spirochaetia bacterium]